MARPGQLPELRGFAFQVFRIVWLALFLVGAVGATYGEWRTDHRVREAQHAYSRIGLHYRSLDPAGIHVVAVSPQAKRAGVGIDDRLVQVGDHRVRAGEAFDDPAIVRHFAGPDGGVVRIVTAARGGGAANATLSLSRGWLSPTYDLRLDILLATAIVADLTCLITALLLFRRRPHDPVVALISLGLMVGLSGVLGELLPTIFSQSARSAPAVVLGAVGAIALPLLMTGILFFPSGKADPPWTRWLLIPIAVFAGMQIAAPYLPTDFFYALLTTGSLLGALVAIGAFQRFRRTPAGRERQQFKWIALGLAAALACVVVSLVAFVLESLVSGPAGGWVSFTAHLALTLPNLIIPLAFLVSLLRYRLYDADAAISRSAAYAVLTLVLGAVFAGSERVVEAFGEGLLGRQAGVAAAGVAAAVAVVVIAPLHDRVRHWAEKRFQRGLADVDGALPQWVETRRDVVSLDTLLSTVLERIAKGVRAVRAAVLIDGRPILLRDVAAADAEAWRAGWAPDRGDGPERDTADPTFPVRLALAVEGVGAVGWILLGPRPDGTLYSREEREALARVAGPIARAVHVMRQRDAHEARLDARIAALESRLSDGARGSPPPVS